MKFPERDAAPQGKVATQSTAVSAHGIHGILPGLLTALMVGLAATFVAEQYGGPQVLYALLFGMVLNHLSGDQKIQPGIEFASRRILRFGVALLGARITGEQITVLGIGPVLMVAGCVVTTIVFGAWIARRLGRPVSEGLLASGSVAICGASAALAISAVLPRTESSQRFTLLTVAGVTGLSTLAMIIYPMLAQVLHFEDVTAGIFLGGTIHDVAQVVGAGYMLSPEAAEAATLVKLFRVALLVPIVLCMSLLFRREQAATSNEAPLLPAFLVGFIVLVAINSIGWIPRSLGTSMAVLSRWCLVISIAALGMKTSLQQLRELGWRPVVMLVGSTVLLASLVVAGIHLLRY